MRGLLRLREEQTGGCLASLPSKATMHLCLTGCHSTFVPLLPEHICATARQRASLGLPHNAPQWRRVSGGAPLSGNCEWEATHGSGPRPPRLPPSKGS